MEIDKADMVVDSDDESMEIDEACLDLGAYKAMEAGDNVRIAPNGSPKKPRKRSNTSGPTKKKSAHRKSAAAYYAYTERGLQG